MGRASADDIPFGDSLGGTAPTQAYYPQHHASTGSGHDLALMPVGPVVFWSYCGKRSQGPLAPP